MITGVEPFTITHLLLCAGLLGVAIIGCVQAVDRAIATRKRRKRK